MTPMLRVARPVKSPIMLPSMDLPIEFAGSVAQSFDALPALVLDDLFLNNPPNCAEAGAGIASAATDIATTSLERKRRTSFIIRAVTSSAFNHILTKTRIEKSQHAATGVA